MYIPMDEVSCSKVDMFVYIVVYSLLKLPFRSKLIKFLKKYFKELAYIYYDKCFLWENLCWVLKKTTQPWFTYFQIADKY